MKVTFVLEIYHGIVLPPSQQVDNILRSLTTFDHKRKERKEEPARHTRYKTCITSVMEVKIWQISNLKKVLV